MYEPKIEVVRETGANSWYPDDGRYRSAERALLVRGVPVPGKRVMDRDGTVHTVRNLEVKWVEVHDGSQRLIKVLRPYDPDEALVDRVAGVVQKMVMERHVDCDAVARAAIAAIKEVDDD